MQAAPKREQRKERCPMKRMVLALSGLLAAATVGWASTASADVLVTDLRPVRVGHHGEVSIGVFYDTLSPYGDWVYVGRYGRVWRPSPGVVGVGFRPYSSGGQWVYTDYGWSFETDWDWGWAPFHYGRWLMDPVYGWVWVPGSTWAPAWVDWRFGEGFIGWAPLAPVGETVYYDAGSPYWNFCESRYFVNYDIHRHLLPYGR